MRRCPLLILIALVPVLAVAAPVDPANPEGIAAEYAVYQSGQEDTHYVLCVDGRIQQIQRYTDPKFRFVPANDPASVPVPVTEIADWSWRSFTTHDGDLWVYHGYDREWYALSQPGSFGPVDCGDPVASETSTMGDLKSSYR